MHYFLLRINVKYLYFVRSVLNFQPDKNNHDFYFLEMKIFGVDFTFIVL